MNTEVVCIPIERIRVANPRYRDKRKFAVVVDSIRKSGLKKPIQVTERVGKPGEDPSYELVCGQGRKEAFESLGFTEIPAIIIKADKETSMLMSLVENMARRTATPQDLVDEILRLKALGYSNAEVGRKLDISDGAVSGLMTLNSSGEERLIYEAMSGKIPVGTAIEIARAETPEQQRAFLEAYENGHLNQANIRTVRRVLAQRNAFSKKLSGYAGATRYRTADGIVDTLKKETQRQKSLIRKTQICEARRVFVVEAFRNLLADEDFTTLLRAEGLDSMPKELNEQITSKP
ncbi:ParB N-terminal domain-containing protein [Luteolibacter arcticus]|uniref:ParB N-terminal domain-containing protein n=1 Tax=Luteolibacter arcticus TaxID=1581411 RepID=A0ABT3GL76_9BACT|nr:ParB N-terminal domain-containing protein [Luteolibacter arcticus]MCW1924252.1 ParB N-terminal domain-containing protein [Luteolibacter arcticus]